MSSLPWCGVLCCTASAVLYAVLLFPVLSAINSGLIRFIAQHGSSTGSCTSVGIEPDQQQHLDHQEHHPHQHDQHCYKRICSAVKEESGTVLVPTSDSMPTTNSGGSSTTARSPFYTQQASAAKAAAAAAAAAVANAAAAAATATSAVDCGLLCHVCCSAGLPLRRFWCCNAAAAVPDQGHASGGVPAAGL